MKSTQIIVAQKNLTVGNITANKTRIIDAILTACDTHKADVIIFPELALSAYPPEDLLFRGNLYQQIQIALQEILPYSEKIDIIISYPEQQADQIYNTCSYLSGGKIQATYHKQRLPNYAVFDEKRYFICEDLWSPLPAKQAAAQGAKLLININASPYRIGIAAKRQKLLARRALETGMAIIYVNIVGGQDELVFDGDSRAVNNKGEIVFQAPQFEEGLYLIDVSRDKGKIALHSSHPAPEIADIASPEASIYQALVLGTRDYVNKNGFKGAVIGLSGGIDSALTLVVAVAALGAENVEAVLMPSRYTSAMSNEDAQLLAETLHVNYNGREYSGPLSWGDHDGPIQQNRQAGADHG